MFLLIISIGFLQGHISGKLNRKVDEKELIDIVRRLEEAECVYALGDDKHEKYLYLTADGKKLYEELTGE